MSGPYKRFKSKDDTELIEVLEALDQAFEGGEDTCVLCERLLTGETFDDEQRKALLFVVRERYKGFVGMRDTVVRQRERIG